MSQKQSRLYNLFFKYPSGLDEFAFKVCNGLIPERSISQMSYNKVIYNLTILTKTHPEIVVYSNIVSRNSSLECELKENSGLDEKTFGKALQTLRKMGLVE